MANKTIKGLTVEIGGDTTKLGQALESVEKQSRSLSGELKDIERLLKLDPHNTELLAQKQKVLTEQIAATNERLKILRESEDQVNDAFARGDASEEQVRALQREIMQAENALKNQTSALDETNATLKGLEDGSIAAAEAEEELKRKTAEADAELKEQKQKAADAKAELGEYAEKGAKAAEKAVAAFGAAVIGSAAALAKLTLEEGKEADSLSDLSKKTGISVERLQEYDYIAAKAGTSLDVMTAAEAKLIKSMSSARKGTGDTADAFRKLDVRVENANGTLRDNDEVFRELLDRLGKVDDETERDALAMQIFGKSAQELNPLILASSKGLEEYRRQAHSLGIIVSDETVSSLADMNDTVKDVTFQFGAAKQELAAEFAPIAQEVLQHISALLKDAKDELKDPEVKKSLKNLGESLLKLVNSGSKLAVNVLPALVKTLGFLADNAKGVSVALLAVWGVLKTVSVVTNTAKAISAVTDALKAMKTASDAAKTAQEGVNTAMSASSTVSAGYVGAIIAIVAALAAFTIAVVENEKKRQEAITATSDALRESVDKIVQGQNEARESYEKTTAETDAAAQKAEQYIKRLEELEKQESLTAGEQSEYNDLVFRLNTLMPELNLETDKNTGRLKKNADAIREQIKQMKERAKFNAIEELYTAALKNNYELEMKLEKAEGDLDEARKKHNDALEKSGRILNAIKDGNILMIDGLEVSWNSYHALIKEVEDYNVELQAAEAAEAAAREAYNASAEELDALSEAYEKTSSESDTFKSKTTGDNGTIGALGELIEALHAAGEEADKFAEDHLAKIIGTSQNMFSKLTTNTRLSMDELLGNLQFNGQVVEEWERNLEIIRERGASEEFIAMLEEAGPAYVETTDEIANATDELFTELTSTWETNTTDAYTQSQRYGRMMVQGLIDGIKEKMAELRQAAAHAALAAADEFANVLEIHSPSRVGIRLGERFDEGVAEGVEGGATDIASASAMAAQAVIHAFDVDDPFGTGIISGAVYAPVAAEANTGVYDTSALTARLDAILVAIEAGQIIALDGDKLVGGTIGRINAELGEDLILTERRQL